MENFLAPNCDFLAVDSLVMLYRLKMGKNPKEGNRMLARHMGRLAKIAEKLKIPVIVTGHVYEWKGKTRIVSGDVAKYWAKTILIFEKTRDWMGKGKRQVKLLKHPFVGEGGSVNFRICDKGIC